MSDYVRKKCVRFKIPQNIIDINDAKIEKAFYFTLFPLQYKAYIKCPECNKKICLGTKNY